MDRSPSLSNSFSNFFTTKPLSSESEMESISNDEKSKSNRNVFYVSTALRFAFLYVALRLMPAASFSCRSKVPSRREIGWRRKRSTSSFIWDVKGMSRKINIVCRCRGVELSISKPPSTEKNRKKTFMKTRYKIYMFMCEEILSQQSKLKLNFFIFIFIDEFTWRSGKGTKFLSLISWKLSNVSFHDLKMNKWESDFYFLYQIKLSRSQNGNSREKSRAQ